MDRNLTIFLIAMVALIVLTPIGLIATGSAYGEWDSDTIQQAVGYVPAGLQSLSGLWNAPLADYGFPGQGDTMADATPGYIFSAIVGVVVVGGLVYVAGKFFIKKDSDQ
ncbi:MAG TPA: PDGLE domain-containing protein [Methanocella sp.]|uniref:PDGLE domain-containing protein n=1 Tax=Methanocella sp. TaxID=2052833 RepID=UPI002C854F03|nr:PDGLE domain-containing protein [Methanocella sp.]HTY91502.1 PDGLE domain-containing protein [Methanocella sp.]